MNIERINAQDDVPWVDGMRLGIRHTFHFETGEIFEAFSRVSGSQSVKVLRIDERGTKTEDFKTKIIEVLEEAYGEGITIVGAFQSLPGVRNRHYGPGGFCPKCQHEWHTKPCLNLQSDNDCSCKTSLDFVDTPDFVADVNKAIEENIQGYL